MAPLPAEAPTEAAVAAPVPAEEAPVAATGNGSQDAAGGAAVSPEESAPAAAAGNGPQDPAGGAAVSAEPAPEAAAPAAAKPKRAARPKRTAKKADPKKAAAGGSKAAKTAAKASAKTAAKTTKAAPKAAAPASARTSTRSRTRSTAKTDAKANGNAPAAKSRSRSSQRSRKRRLQYKVGQQLVYPLQGVGQVRNIEERPFRDDTLLYYVVYLEVSDMTIMVPVDRADELGIRAIVPRAEARSALALISEDYEPIPTDWKLRYQMNLDLLKAGTVSDIATVVRALYHRSRIKELPILERKLYDNARSLLVDELSFSLGKDKAKVEELINARLEVGVNSAQ